MVGWICRVASRGPRRPFHWIKNPIFVKPDDHFIGVHCEGGSYGWGPTININIKITININININTKIKIKIDIHIDINIDPKYKY